MKVVPEVYPAEIPNVDSGRPILRSNSRPYSPLLLPVTHVPRLVLDVRPGFRLTVRSRPVLRPVRSRDVVGGRRLRVDTGSKDLRRRGYLHVLSKGSSGLVHKKDSCSDIRTKGRKQTRNRRPVYLGVSF